MSEEQKVLTEPEEWIDALDPGRKDRELFYKEKPDNEALVETIKSLDAVVRTILEDFVKSIKSIAQTEMTLLTVAARIDALTELLVEKEVLDQAAINETYQKKLQGSVEQILASVAAKKQTD